MGQSFAEALSASPLPEQLIFNSEAAFEWARKKGKKVAPGLALVRNLR